MTSSEMLSWTPIAWTATQGQAALVSQWQQQQQRWWKRSAQSIDLRFPTGWTRTLPRAGSSVLFLFGATSAITLTPAGRTNTPYPSRHVKYAFPWTEPLFLPFGASSSTPIHLPGAKAVVPVKRTMPLPLAVETRVPTATEASICLLS